MGVPRAKSGFRVCDVCQEPFVRRPTEQLRRFQVRARCSTRCHGVAQRRDRPAPLWATIAIPGQGDMLTLAFPVSVDEVAVWRTLKGDRPVWLSTEERAAVIAEGLATGVTPAGLARALGVPTSTLEKEIGRATARRAA